jgi:hypothetical protein
MQLQNNHVPLQARDKSNSEPPHCHGRRLPPRLFCLSCEIRKNNFAQKWDATLPPAAAAFACRIPATSASSAFLLSVAKVGRRGWLQMPWRILFAGALSLELARAMVQRRREEQRLTAMSLQLHRTTSMPRPSLSCWPLHRAMQ